MQRAKTKPVYHSSPQNNATILTMLWCPEIGLELDEGGATLSVGWPCVRNFLSLGISHMKWLQNWLEMILLLFCVNVHVVKHLVLCLVSLYYNTINSCFKIDYYPWMEIRVDLFMVECRSTVPYIQLLLTKLSVIPKCCDGYQGKNLDNSDVFSLFSREYLF